ncbi:(d)CMP kinase [Anaerobacillus sp. MEB173]|uniref:(d)CMP kinase n=1 Tax=Anaerobacillus sp. MEB173 TaxID=3383345 RepID=UPI003F8DD2BA
MMKKINIAIDGPAGAGKSTVARLVAQRLSYLYIDTGAMYRALAYKALQHQVDLNDGVKLKELLDQTKIELYPLGTGKSLELDNIDVSHEIRSQEVTNNVSIVASHAAVRHEMLRRQQQLAKAGGTVMDGRDIGTAVLPEAEVKVFLTASVDIRAKRRHEENIAKGFDSNLQQLKEEIALRDKRDSERAVAPLRKAADAVEINTTEMSIDQVVEDILALVKERA